MQESTSRERFTEKDEADIRLYVQEADSSVGGIEAFNFDYNPGGGTTNFAPSDWQLARAERYRWVDSIRRDLLAQPDGDTHWLVLSVAYGLRIEPRPRVPDTHPKQCNPGCTCVEETSSYYRAWVASTEAMYLKAIGACTSAARARAIDLGGDALKDAAGVAAYHSELETMRQEDVERARSEYNIAKRMKVRGIAHAMAVMSIPDAPAPGMRVAQKVFEVMRRASMPESALMEYAHGVVTPDSRKLNPFHPSKCTAGCTCIADHHRWQETWRDKDFQLEVREQATEMLLDARDAWVLARRRGRAVVVEQKARARAEEERVKRERSAPAGFLADVVSSVRALMESSAEAAE